MSGQPGLLPRSPRGGVDASVLPTEGFGPTTPPWWGTIAFMVMEGTSLVICVATYIYLRRNFESYPPYGYALPSLLIPTVNVALMLLSLPIAGRVDRMAKRHDRAGVINWSCILLGFGTVILVLRIFELEALNVRWDSNAYGSTVWFTAGLHSLLLLIDYAESLAIALIFILDRQEEKHFSDTSDDVFYWYFVVASWVTLYLVLYVSPRVF